MIRILINHSTFQGYLSKQHQTSTLLHFFKSSKYSLLVFLLLASLNYSITCLTFLWQGTVYKIEQICEFVSDIFILMDLSIFLYFYSRNLRRIRVSQTGTFRYLVILRYLTSVVLKGSFFVFFTVLYFVTGTNIVLDEFTGTDLVFVSY